MKEMLLSMVIPTLGRVKEIGDLLHSIEISKLDFGYEIIIVDQNETNLLEDILAQYKKDLPILHKKVNFKGSSKARNYGTKISRGKYICYPDDDCTFEKDTIKRAITLLEKEDWDCVCGRSYDRVTGRDSMFIFPKHDKVLTCSNMDNSFVEFAMFFKRQLPIEFPYDENLGPGTIHGCHEGYDATYRMLQQGKRFFYTTELIYNHPEKRGGTNSESDLKRAFYYSCGLGYLCKKHKFKYKFCKRYLLLSLACPFIYVFRHESFRYYKVQVYGLKIGYKYF